MSISKSGLYEPSPLSWKHLGNFLDFCRVYFTFVWNVFWRCFHEQNWTEKWKFVWVLAISRRSNFRAVETFSILWKIIPAKSNYWSKIRKRVDIPMKINIISLACEVLSPQNLILDSAFRKSLSPLYFGNFWCTSFWPILRYGLLQPLYEIFKTPQGFL